MAFPARPGFTFTDLGDFEEALADKLKYEKWELIGGRVVKTMLGARWEHHRLVRNFAHEIDQRFWERGSSGDVFTETFWLKAG